MKHQPVLPRKSYWTADKKRPNTSTFLGELHAVLENRRSKLQKHHILLLSFWEDSGIPQNYQNLGSRFRDKILHQLMRWISCWSCSSHATSCRMSINRIFSTCNKGLVSVGFYSKLTLRMLGSTPNSSTKLSKRRMVPARWTWTAKLKEMPLRFKTPQQPLLVGGKHLAEPPVWKRK